MIKNSTSVPDLSSQVQYHPRIAFDFGVVIILLGMAVLFAQFGLTNGLKFASFALGPLLLALIPMWQFRSQPCQSILLFADIVYLLWFLIYMTFVTDARKAFTAFLIGTMGVPTLIALCYLAWWFHRRYSRSPSVLIPGTQVLEIRRFPPIAFVVSVFVVSVGTVLVCIEFGFPQGAYCLPVVFGPLMIAWIPMWHCRTKRSQYLLLFSNIAVVVCFLYFLLPLLYHRPGEFDILAPIAVGFFSSPVLLCLCIIGVVLHWLDSRPKREKPEREEPIL